MPRPVHGWGKRVRFGALQCGGRHIEVWVKLRDCLSAVSASSTHARSIAIDGESAEISHADRRTVRVIDRVGCA